MWGKKCALFLASRKRLRALSFRPSRPAPPLPFYNPQSRATSFAPLRHCATNFSLGQSALAWKMAIMPNVMKRVKRQRWMAKVTNIIKSFEKGYPYNVIQILLRCFLVSPSKCDIMCCSKCLLWWCENTRKIFFALFATAPLLYIRAIATCGDIHKWRASAKRWDTQL